MSLAPRYAAAPGRVAWVMRFSTASLTRDQWSLATGLVLAGIIVTGMAIGVGVVSLAGVMLSLFVALVSPATGLVVLAVISPLSPPLVLPAPGVPPAMVAAILGGCLGRMAVERRPLSVGLPLFLAIGFMLYLFAQQTPEMLTLWAGPQGRETVTTFIQITTVFVAALATALVVRGRPVTNYLVGLGVGAFIAASVALIVYVVPSPPVFVENLTNEMRITARSIGPFLDPNYFGTFLATAAVLFMAAYPMARSRVVRVAIIVLEVAIVAALVTTLSRGAFVALLAGVLALTLTINWRWTFVTALTSAIVVVLVYPAFSAYRFGEARSASIQALDESGRQYAAAAGIRIFESSPLFGVGLGHYPEATVRIAELPGPIESHNWYVNVLAEQGLVGIVLWLGLMLIVFRAVWMRDGLARRAGVALLAAAAAGAISLQTPASFQTSALTAIGLTMAMVGLWPRGRASAPAPVVTRVRPRRPR